MLPHLRVLPIVIAVLFAFAFVAALFLGFVNLPTSGRRVLVEFADHPRNMHCRRAVRFVETDALSIANPKVTLEFPKIRATVEFTHYELRDGGQLTFIGESAQAPLKVILLGRGWRCDR